MLSIGFYPDMKEIQRYLPKTAIHATLFSATYLPHAPPLPWGIPDGPAASFLPTTQIHAARSSTVLRMQEYGKVTAR